MKKILVIIIFTLLLVSNVFADENVETKYNRKPLVTGIETLDEINLKSKYIITIPSDIDAETATEYINRKLYEIIHNLQVIAQAVCITAFIISAFIALISCVIPIPVFGRGFMSGFGLFGCIMSVVVYVLILYAPEIFQNALAFVAS